MWTLVISHMLESPMAFLKGVNQSSSACLHIPGEIRSAPFAFQGAMAEFQSGAAAHGSMADDMGGKQSGS